MELNTITNSNGSKIFFSFNKNLKILGRTLTPSNVSLVKSVDNDLYFGKPNTFIYKKIVDELGIKDDSAFFDFTINGVKSVVEFSISDQGHVQFNIKEMKFLFQPYSKGKVIEVEETAIILDFNNRIVNLMKISDISMKYPYDSGDFKEPILELLLDNDYKLELTEIYSKLSNKMCISKLDKELKLDSTTETHYNHKIINCLQTLKNEGKLVNEAHSSLWEISKNYNEKIDEKTKKELKIIKIKYSDNKSEEELDDLEVYIESKIKHRNPRLQKNFRRLLIEEFHGKCAICNCNEKRLLIASHIIPFSKCVLENGEIDEDLIFDKNNGLLLCPNHDALFDKNFISFNVNGEIEISNQFLEKEFLMEVFAINNQMKLNTSYLTEKRKNNLEKHILKEGEE